MNLCQNLRVSLLKRPPFISANLPSNISNPGADSQVCPVQDCLPFSGSFYQGKSGPMHQPHCGFQKPLEPEKFTRNLDGNMDFDKHVLKCWNEFPKKTLPCNTVIHIDGHQVAGSFPG